MAVAAAAAPPGRERPEVSPASVALLPAVSGRWPVLPSGDEATARLGHLDAERGERLVVPRIDGGRDSRTVHAEGCLAGSRAPATR